MKIAVFGAGLVGSLYATLMAQLGHKVVVYEKRSDPRNGVTGRSRSINLALSVRGWKALGLAGLKQKVESIVIPMNGRMIHQVGKETALQPYSQYNKSIYSVSRNDLNSLLISEAENSNCTFHFGYKVMPSSQEESEIQVIDFEGNAFTPKADLYIGADGANSLVRSYIKGGNYRVDKISHSYKEIEIPASVDGEHKLFKNALHIWPRGAYMFIGLPNMDGSYTGTLFLPNKGENSFDELRTKEDITTFFEAKFPDAYSQIPDLVEQFLSNPTSNLATVWADDWYDEDKKIGLIGDASHGIVPFYGQGMNSGFEDCSVLYELLEKEGFDNHFEKFANSRKKDTDAIAYLSMGNFVEMRDLVAQPKFKLQKKIERKIQAQYPDHWMPLYTMVSFSNIPYSEVYEKSISQQKIMDEVLDIPDVETLSKEDDLSIEVLNVLRKYLSI